MNVMGLNIKSAPRLSKKPKQPPAAVFLTALYERETLTQKNTYERKFQQVGIPFFPTMSRCAFALNILVEYGERF